MAGHPSGRSSRRHRIVLSCHAMLQDHPTPQVISGWTCNLGEGGACLDLSFDPDLMGGFVPGSLLSLTLHPEEDPLSLEGRVVWVGPPTPPVGTQHGVAFPRLTSEQRRRLDSLVQRRGRSWTPAVSGWTGKFRVLFRGDLKPGMRAEDAKGRLARLLQVDDAALQDLIRSRGEVWIVKQGLDRPMAERYVAAFEAAGALCRVEADSPR